MSVVSTWTVVRSMIMPAPPPLTPCPPNLFSTQVLQVLLLMLMPRNSITVTLFLDRQPRSTGITVLGIDA